MTDLAASVVRSTFAVGAKLRHARVFHPDGLDLSGRLHATSEYEHLFGTGERAVIARLSKGTGTPGSLPDVLGLAFRVLDRHNRPWDFALATTGGGPLSRFVILPARGWVHARYGSLMPYRVGKTMPLWFFAEPDTGQPTSASLAAMAEYLREHTISFELLASGITGQPARLGSMTLRLAESAEHRTDFFDPMLNHPDGVELLPRMVGKVREFAYAGSRNGRGEAE